MGNWIDAALWWVGFATVSIGGIGVLAALAMWSVDQVLSLTGFSKAIVQAYGQYLDGKKRRSYIPG